MLQLSHQLSTVGVKTPGAETLKSLLEAKSTQR